MKIVERVLEMIFFNFLLWIGSCGLESVIEIMLIIVEGLVIIKFYVCVRYFFKCFIIYWYI